MTGASRFLDGVWQAEAKLKTSALQMGSASDLARTEAFGKAIANREYLYDDEWRPIPLDLRCFAQPMSLLLRGTFLRAR